MAGSDVTLGVLGAKLDAVNDKLDSLCDKVDSLNGMIRTHETKIARIEERQTVWTKLQAAFTVIASVIAAFFGAQK